MTLPTILFSKSHRRRRSMIIFLRKIQKMCQFLAGGSMTLPYNGISKQSDKLQFGVFFAGAGNRNRLNQCSARSSPRRRRSSAPQGTLSSKAPMNVSFIGAFVVPVTGIEPVRILLRGILSPLCLPIPPQRRMACSHSSTFFSARQGKNSGSGQIYQFKRGFLCNITNFQEVFCDVCCVAF